MAAWTEKKERDGQLAGQLAAQGPPEFSEEDTEKGTGREG